MDQQRDRWPADVNPCSSLSGLNDWFRVLVTGGLVLVLIRKVRSFSSIVPVHKDSLKPVLSLSFGPYPERSGPVP